MSAPVPFVHRTGETRKKGGEGSERHSQSYEQTIHYCVGLQIRLGVSFVPLFSLLPPLPRSMHINGGGWDGRGKPRGDACPFDNKGASEKASRANENRSITRGVR